MILPNEPHRIVPHKDGDTNTYTIPTDPDTTLKRNDSVPIKAWWGRDGRKKTITIDHTPRGVHHRITTQEEHFILRQENEAAGKADLIILSPGQVYDLIDVLNQAVEKP